MTIDRAIEILYPNHREHYDGIDEVNEACLMGMKALAKQKPLRPIKRRGIMRDKRYSYIANYYGMTAQLLQTIEECAELIQAINKYMRALSNVKKAPCGSEEYQAVKDARLNVAEEAADVQIMVNQISILLGINAEIEEQTDRKLKRTTDRIRKENIS